MNITEDPGTSAIQRRREEQANRSTPTSNSGSIPMAMSTIASVTPAAHQPASSGVAYEGSGVHAGGGSSAQNTSPIPFDPVRLLSALQKRWWLIIAVGFILGGIAGGFGFWKFENAYTATVQLMRRELPNTFRASDLGESFKPRQFSVGTVTAMMQSPGLLAKVGDKSQPKVPIGEIAANLTVTPEKNTDLITVTLKGRNNPRAVSELINLYAEEVVNLTRSLQSQEAAELNRFLKDQLSKTENELLAVNEEMLVFSREANFYSADKQIEAYLRAMSESETRLQNARLELEGVDFRIASAIRELSQQDPLKLKLTEAKAALDDLRVRYTELHPLITEQQAKVNGLEELLKQSTNVVENFQAGANTLANNLYLDLVNYRSQRKLLTRQIPELESTVTNVQARLQSLPEKSHRHARIKARQNALEGTRDLLAGRQREAELFTENSPGYYRLFAQSDPSQVQKSSRAKKIFIVTAGAMILGLGFSLFLVCLVEILDDRVRTPGDLRRVTRSRVLTHLRDMSTMSPQDVMNWRFRAWSTLQRHLGVADGSSFILGFLSATSGEGSTTVVHQLQLSAAEREWRTISIVDRLPEGTQSIPLATALAHPREVLKRLEQERHLYVVYDPATHWDATLRSKWHTASLEWITLPRTAVFLELPPAWKLESILLAETVPQIFWVASSDTMRQNQLTPLFSTIRMAEVRIKGAILNRVPDAIARLPDLSKFGFAWLVFLMATHLNAIPLSAADSSTLPLGSTNVYLSATAGKPTLAAWQERLTLGPGDLVDLQIFGQKQFTRTLVPVGPDGRINYLQANGVTASGLTPDELRDVLGKELSKFIKNPQVIVKPASWRSKRYYILGTIMDRGSFTLDRPMTIIEATARARGIATGLLEQNTVEIADLPRAFLVRKGKRVPVDFVKLFQHGDLSQNIQLEPDDYIYFPSSTLNEVYILGAVSSPGTVGVSDHASLVGILTTRGGYTTRAWRQRVLVIRGSLTKPETHVVDLRAILEGRAKDFPILPKDIIFVAERPWIYAEELLDTAIRSFIQTATTTWVNHNIQPITTEPFVPGL